MAEGVEMNEQIPEGSSILILREMHIVLTQLTDQLDHLSTMVANQGISQNITPFDWNSKDFFQWI